MAHRISASRCRPGQLLAVPSAGPDPERPILAGDFQADGVVDGTDYNVWRATFGTVALPGVGADGNANGVVDAADYVLWRKTFSNTGVTPCSGADGDTIANDDNARAAHFSSTGPGTASAALTVDASAPDPVGLVNEPVAASGAAPLAFDSARLLWSDSRRSPHLPTYSFRRLYWMPPSKHGQIGELLADDTTNRFANAWKRRPTVTIYSCWLWTALGIYGGRMYRRPSTTKAVTRTSTIATANAESTSRRRGPWKRGHVRTACSTIGSAPSPGLHSKTSQSQKLIDAWDASATGRF